MAWLQWKPQRITFFHRFTPQFETIAILDLVVSVICNVHFFCDIRHYYLKLKSEIQAKPECVDTVSRRLHDSFRHILQIWSVLSQNVAAIIL